MTHGEFLLCIYPEHRDAFESWLFAVSDGLATEGYCKNVDGDWLHVTITPDEPVRGLYPADIDIEIAGDPCDSLAAANEPIVVRQERPEAAAYCLTPANAQTLRSAKQRGYLYAR